MDHADDVYHVILPIDQEAKLSVLHATKCNAGPCTVTKVASESADFVTYRLDMEKTVPVNSKGSIQVVGYYTRVLEAYPAEIRQSEDQLMVYSGDHLFLSPFPTTKETTNLKLPTLNVESYSKLEPTTLKGTKLKCGPYSNTRAYTRDHPLSIHFRHHAPFIQLTNVVKEIEVSMWGSVSVEEVVDLEHSGAKLKGGFSRFDYDHKNQKSASYDVITANFPRHASEIYYRDIIGKILTSSTTPKKKKTMFQMKPRFPLFGGWKTQWYMGYHVPTEDVVTVDGTSFTLSMEFSSAIDKAAIDDLTTKVILPEGATNIRAVFPFEVEHESMVKRHTYLDSKFIGRPVLVVKKSNLVPYHNTQEFQVMFDFDPKFLWHEPLLLFAGYMSFFLLVMVLSRWDFSIISSESTVSKTKTN